MSSPLRQMSENRQGAEACVERSQPYEKRAPSKYIVDDGESWAKSCEKKRNRKIPTGWVQDIWIILSEETRRSRPTGRVYDQSQGLLWLYTSNVAQCTQQIHEA